MASSVSLAAAFLAGLVSFISPCVLPIVPGYLSFISGVNIAQFKEGGAPRDLVRRVALTSLVFVLGFSTVFVALGAAATYVGYILQEHKRTLGVVGGIAGDLGRACAEWDLSRHHSSDDDCRDDGGAPDSLDKSSQIGRGGHNVQFGAGRGYQYKA